MREGIVPSSRIPFTYSSGAFGTPNPTYIIDALIASHSPNASAGVKKVCALASSPSVGLKLTARTYPGVGSTRWRSVMFVIPFAVRW